MPKHSGGFRPIFNLRSLNQWVAYEHFKMEGIATIKEVVKQGDWMTRLDLKDAYLTIPIHPKEQKFFQFVWRGRKYQFVSLPFGLSSAPRLFTKLLRPVVGYLRSIGIRVVIYLDDLLLLNHCRLHLVKDTEFVISVLQNLGFVINWTKSALVPTKSIVYLGLIVDSNFLTFSLPEDKRSKVINSCQKILKIPYLF